MRRGVVQLWRLPGKLMVATMLLCLALREWYPFSPFPMYATFSPRASYICVVDAGGQPLPSARYFGVDATMFKKIFETHVLALVAAGQSAEAAEAAAAQQTLALIIGDAHPEPGTPPLPARVGLQRTVAELDGERIQRTQAILARLGAE